MPRAQVYITQNNYKRIQSIVDAKKEDGADRTEANVSSVAAMLLDIGLRVYEFQQKKENELSEENNELPERYPEVVNKAIVENILKATISTTILLQMVGEIKEVKDIKEFSYEKLKGNISEKVDKKLIEIFQEGDGYER